MKPGKADLQGDTTVNKLNDVHDALQEIQFMTQFLGTTCTGGPEINLSPDLIFGGNLLFGLLDKRISEVVDNLEEITNEVKANENRSKNH